jgi:hypothetical protein
MGAGGVEGAVGERQGVGGGDLEPARPSVRAGVRH